MREQGRFWEAVKEVRTRWQIEPLTTLPTETENILYPPGVEELITKESYAAYTDLRKRLRGTPHEVALLRGASLNVLRYVQPPGDPEELHNICSDLMRCWEGDIGGALLQGRVPEGYLEDRPPHYGSPPFSAYRLSWYRFGAACVLHAPPIEEKDVSPLVEYGGFPLLSGEAKAQEEPVLGVVSGQELKERQMQQVMVREYDEMVVEKMWELYPELGESDFESAKRQFYQRYPNEAAKIEEEAARRVREWHDFATVSEHNRIELDLETVTSQEVERMLDVVRGREGHHPQGGRPAVRSRVFKVQCAVLLDDRNSPDPEKPVDKRRRKWTHKKLEEKFGLESEKVASDLARAGREEIQKKESN